MIFCYSDAFQPLSALAVACHPAPNCCDRWFHWFRFPINVVRVDRPFHLPPPPVPSPSNLGNWCHRNTHSDYCLCPSYFRFIRKACPPSLVQHRLLIVCCLSVPILQTNICNIVIYGWNRSATFGNPIFGDHFLYHSSIAIQKKPFFVRK